MVKCKCGTPLYWCATCGAFHHDPARADSAARACVRAGGPFVEATQR